MSLEMSPCDRAHTTSYWRSIVTMACRFWDIQCRKMLWHWNPCHRSPKVIESGTIWKTGYGFLLVFYSNFVPKKHRFWDNRLVTIQWLWNPGYGSLKVIGTDTYRSATYNFLLTFHSNHRPISYRFRNKRQFRSRIAKFSLPPRVFCDPAEAVPLGIGYRRRGQTTRMMGLPDWERILTMSSAVWIQCIINVTDGRTDRHRATAKTALIRIASRGTVKTAWRWSMLMLWKSIVCGSVPLKLRGAGYAINRFDSWPTSFQILVSPSSGSIIWYRPEIDDALAMRRREEWYSHLWAHSLWMEDEHPRGTYTHGRVTPLSIFTARRYA